MWDRLAERLSEEAREKWVERLSPYLDGRPHEVSFESSSEETEAHLEKLGGRLAELAEALAEGAPESEACALAKRTLREQYVFEPSLGSSLEEPSLESSPEEPLEEGAEPTDSEGAVRGRSQERKSLRKKSLGKTAPMTVSAVGPMEVAPMESSRVQPKKSVPRAYSPLTIRKRRTGAKMERNIRADT